MHAALYCGYDECRLEDLKLTACRRAAVVPAEVTPERVLCEDEFFNEAEQTATFRRPLLGPRGCQTDGKNRHDKSHGCRFEREGWPVHDGHLWVVVAEEAVQEAGNIACGEDRSRKVVVEICPADVGQQGNGIV